MGLTNEQLKSGDIFKTIYATWDNLGLKKVKKDIKAYQLTAYITNRLGIHEGSVFKYHQTQMAKKKTSDDSYLSDLQLLQYDLLYGSHYATNEKAQEASDLKMGTQEVIISKLSVKEDKLVVTGKNLTPWSIVYVNDKEVDTTYVSGHKLTISSNDIKEGDVITVKIVGGGNKVFRTSNRFIVTNSVAQKISEKKEEATEHKTKEK